MSLHVILYSVCLSDANSCCYYHANIFRIHTGVKKITENTKEQHS